MIPLLIFLAVMVSLAAVALLFWWSSIDQQARRDMRAAPRRRIEDVRTAELARIAGQVELARTIEAPLSGRPCAYWHVTVQQLRPLRSSSRWVTIIDDQRGVDFLVRDGSGAALVKPRVVRSVLVKDGKFSSGRFNDAAPRLEAFLAQRGYSSQGWVLNKSLRYSEGIVAAGEQVCVVGVGTWETDPNEKPDGGDGYREVNSPKRLVIQSHGEGPLLLSDEPSLVR